MLERTFYGVYIYIFSLCGSGQIKGFDVKRVDEFHLTGMESGTFVGWEHRPAPAGEGRMDGKAKPEPKTHTEKKEKKVEYTKGKVSVSPICMIVTKP